MKEIRKNQVRQGEKELTLEDVDNEKVFAMLGEVEKAEEENRGEKTKGKKQSLRQKRQERAARRKANKK